ncbi:MAG: hydantoinase B/oxoprolinase family protein [Acidimicrobiia bacterium]|nr:hydantoinase B/oxoprolinase family protein [Acidimicrobiia bacterium]
MHTDESNGAPRRSGWEFWVDRGGTFTDVVARRPDGATLTHKLLSENPRHYDDAAIQAIRDLLGLVPGDRLPSEEIAAIKMGTTVATNALLERKGEPTVLVTTRGFADALRIGYQARPYLFTLDIVLPEMLYREVVEVPERVSAHGEVLIPLDVELAAALLAEKRTDGFDSVAISLMHGYRHTKHEELLARIARSLGFAQVSVSHEVSPLMKLVARGDTTVVDAYLSPVLRRYVDHVDARLRPEPAEPRSAPRLLFMQSNGGLTDARRFQGKDSLLSGPAGGVVGMIRTAETAGFDRLIGFDMGGTSTDVSHYAGELERTYETEVAGVRVRAPMIHIHTVAAGGGSVLHFNGSRMRVGPDSAGAAPGPACYGNGGPLAITDCNVLLGKLRAEYFPHIFGPDGDQGLDSAEVRARFEALASEVTDATGAARTPESLAEGFLSITCDNMANAIKKISVQRGYDVSAYTLVCFGGAGGQHACLVADNLGIERIHVHPQAGVLSAVGIGLADVRKVYEQTVEVALTADAFAEVTQRWRSLAAEGRRELLAQGVAEQDLAVNRRLSLRYAGSDTSFFVDGDEPSTATAQFEELHRARFGFVSPDSALIIEAAQVEVIGRAAESHAAANPTATAAVAEARLGIHDVWFDGGSQPTPFLDRDRLRAGDPVPGPAVIVEAIGTTIVEPGWTAVTTPAGDLVIERVASRRRNSSVGVEVDPVQLEIFNNLFMNIAEQMGVVLENTASSVNIKERLDFSCAVFDPGGDLVANAPHMPVHLGSMSESIKATIAKNPTMKPGDLYVMNAPYDGGTHLPDITVIKPVFAGRSGVGTGPAPTFYVASRGHHADIGGSVPGSAPCDSTTIEEEGVLLDNELLVENDRFREERIRALLIGGRYPARNPDQNIADLKAQVAACEKGAAELARVIDYYGLDVVHSYMNHVKDNAEESVRRVIQALSDSSFTGTADDGSQVSVAITVDQRDRSAVIDFTGTSPTHPGNFNAPPAVAFAAVLYVFRCLVDDDIPLNAGCMKPLRLVLPPESMINPSYPAAVIAGNVETSQLIVDTLFGALGVAAASQGTMNNVIWGNDTHQYYETVCGGAGATPNADGCDAVHTHMTNSRLTDPEVLEWRHPVVLESFAIRTGSGGAGTHRGGDGVVRRVRFGEAMELNVISGRRSVPPYGMAGGRPGHTGRNRLIRHDGTTVELRGSDHTLVEPGDVFEIHTPGGGGYGPPLPDDAR